MEARSLLKSIREELKPLNREILNHPFINEVVGGVLPLQAIQEFVKQQYYIVYHDVRSIAYMVSKTKTLDELDFFTKLYYGDYQAIHNLLKMAENVGLKVATLELVKPIPEAVAYTHYLTWLAHYANPGEQAFALIVNLPVWGENCLKLSKALKANYDIRETSFLDSFAGPYEMLEEEALRIMKPYIAEERFRNVALTIQRYEYIFWDGLYKHVKKPTT
ncbi:MAG: TenA family transcriptional regulator [Candidatus Bathyarchaeota archaeon]|nr:TenA family transcriptional regulator [Candidatus Bathyarchaeota archaeon]